MTRPAATWTAAGPLPSNGPASDLPFAARVVPWVLAVGGGIGMLAAFILTIEKINLLTDPGYRPTCSINPILSCGSVMTTPQAAAFGFPNPLIGIAGFSVVATLGVLLLSGVRPPRWCWLGLQAGVTFGVVFVHWLIYQSLYRIGAGFLFVAARRTPPTGLVPMLSAFVGTLMLLSVNDLATGRVESTRLVSHSFLLAGYAIVVAMSRVHQPLPGPTGRNSRNDRRWRLTDDGAAEPAGPRLLPSPHPGSARHRRDIAA
jgi:uncharacterized membrane protein